MKTATSVLCGLSLLAQLSGRTVHAQTSPAPTNGQTPEPAVVAPVAALEQAPQQAPALEPAAVGDQGSLVRQPGGLTAESVESRVLAASPSLSEKRAELDAVGTRIAQTRIRFFPQLELRGSYTRLSPVTTSLGNGALVGAANSGPVTIGPCPPNVPAASCAVDSMGSVLGATPSKIVIPNNAYALGAHLTVPLSDYAFRTAYAIASDTSNRDAAKHSLKAEELRVRADARVLYFNWLRTHGQVGIAEQAVQQARARREEAQAAFDLGKLSRADLLKLEALVANAGLAVQQAENGRGLVGQQLAIVMGDPNGQNYAVGEDVPTLEANDADLVADPKQLDAALARRLELKAIDDTARMLAHGQAATKVGRAPRVDAVAQFDYGNPNQRYFPPTQVWKATWSVGLVASWNVTDAFVTDARVDELSAKRAALVAQRDAIARSIAAEIATAQAAVSNARAALAAGNTSLEAAQEGYRVATEQFRLGQTTASYVVDAESDLLNARLGLFNARIDLTTALIRLEHALGHDVPNA